MEDLGVTLKALVLLVIALGVIVGSLVVSPALLVALVVFLAWANLVGLIALTRV